MQPATVSTGAGHCLLRDSRERDQGAPEGRRVRGGRDVPSNSFGDRFGMIAGTIRDRDYGSLKGVPAGTFFL